MDFAEDRTVESQENDLPAQFLQMQKHHLFDLQVRFERYCNMLPVFGFNNNN